MGERDAECSSALVWGLQKVEERKWRCFDDLCACAYNADNQCGGERQERRLSDNGSAIHHDREDRPVCRWMTIVLGGRDWQGLASSQALPPIV